MAKRYFVQLAHDHTNEPLALKYLSEKLDGNRAFWDGGVSRGVIANSVPFANTVKDDRYQGNIYATGLWSRGAKVIHAPEWFLDALPKFCLDGELYLGRSNFQELRTIVSTLIPDERWRRVTYNVFDKPSPPVIFEDGTVQVAADIQLQFKGCLDWYNKRKKIINPQYGVPDFHTTYLFLMRELKETENFKLHPQFQLPKIEYEAKQIVEFELERITSLGGEGLMIRSPWEIWRPNRVYSILKIKKLQYGTAVVIGYTTGRETDKGSKHLGRMGALIVNFQGKRLELSGFTDVERILKATDGTKPLDLAFNWACTNPSYDTPAWIMNPLFPRGSVIKFIYRELTDDGIPKEARYLR